MFCNCNSIQPYEFYPYKNIKNCTVIATQLKTLYKSAHTHTGLHGLISVGAQAGFDHYEEKVGHTGGAEEATEGEEEIEDLHIQPLHPCQERRAGQ